MSTDNFKWTTQLVNEFACKLVMSKEGVGYTIQDFIDSKQPPLSKDKERIEVKHFGLDRQYQYGVNEHILPYYLINLSQTVNVDKWDSIKQAIEDVLNESDTIDIDWASKPVTEKYYKQSEVDAIREETFLASRRLNGAKKCSCYDMKFPYYTDYLNSLNPDNKAYTKEDIERWSNSTGNRWADKKDMESQPQPRTEKSDTGKDSKEWEILTWLSPTGEVATLISGGIECNLKAGYTIRSVRRLSDNTVFSVGDEVYVTCSDGKGFRDTINHFTFTGGVDIIDVYFKDQLHTTFGIHWLNIAKPAPTQTVTDNSDVACLSITDIKEVMPKYTYELFKKDFENKLNQKLKTHTP